MNQTARNEIAGHLRKHLEKRLGKSLEVYYDEATRNGKTVAQMAKDLDISPKTVRNHLHRLGHKHKSGWITTDAPQCAV